MTISQTSRILTSAVQVLFILLLMTFASTNVDAAARRKLTHSRLHFISIDCGIEEGNDYEDEDAEIQYVSDTDFTDTGINMNISPEFLPDTQNFRKLLATLRSFPNGENNCYTIKPPNAQGKEHLIRAFFMYGNYDSKHELPSFSLYVDVNEWDRVSFSNASEIVIKEIIHHPRTDYIHVCLVNKGTGTPFVSALEVRQLNSTIYVTQSDDISLALYRRLDHGSTSRNKFERYGDDFYDRIWEPEVRINWESIAATYNGELFSDNVFKPSASVMSTAVQPKGGKSLNFNHITYQNEQFYLYLHFLEVEELQQNQTRKFTIDLNNASWSGPVDPNERPKTIYSNYSVGGTNSLDFSIYMTNDSTLPPILNAMEYYMARKFLQLPTVQSNVDAMIIIKEKYGIKKNWQGDPCTPMEFKWDGVECRNDDLGRSEIMLLNLSFTGLTKEIISSFSDLDSLQSLDLSYNNLEGNIPDLLAEMRSLRTLNLSGNKLIGSIPQSLIEKSENGLLTLSVDGNPGLCFSGSCKKKNNHTKTTIIIVVPSLLVPCLALVTMIVIVLKRKRKTKDISNVQKKEGPFTSKNKAFTYSEIVDITNSFETSIGKGGSGVVYLGYLDDGSKVAVKMFSLLSTFGLKEFETEVQLLMRIHHRNLVSLVGYCSEGTNMALVCEYMAFGNLQENLSGKTSNHLTWKDRVQIAIDAAQGLEYLHNGCKPPIIHRDMKSANILLNEKLQAKVADFGLSRIFASESDTHVSTTIVGTNGYLDPEYSSTSKLNEKSDVYSFGIVLPELITGKPAIIKGTDVIHIVTWVKERLEKGDIREIIDPTLRGIFNVNSAWKLLETAMACIPPTAIQRSSMSDVLGELKEALAIEMPHEIESSSAKNLTTMAKGSKDDFDIEMSPTAR